jgi:hypothetical protein
VLEEHLLNDDAAEGVGEEDDFGVVPDVGLRETSEEDFSELSASAFAVGVGSGVLGDEDVGIGEVWVGADKVGPVGAVGSAEGIFVAVNAVDEDDDAGMEWGLRVVELGGDVGSEDESEYEECEIDFDCVLIIHRLLDFHLHGALST